MWMNHSYVVSKIRRWYFWLINFKKIWMHCHILDQKATRRLVSAFLIGKLLPPIMLLLFLLFYVPSCMNDFYLFGEKISFKIYTNDKLLTMDSTCTNCWWHTLTKLFYFSLHEQGGHWMEELKTNSHKALVSLTYLKKKRDLVFNI